MTEENTISFKQSTSFIPADSTLKKYGLTFGEWMDFYNQQHGACAICHSPFKLGHRVNVDHVHVKGWNRMAPELRKQYVRGLLCYQCNKFAAMRGMTSTKAWNLWMYMRAFEVRVRGESHPELPPAHEYPQRRRAAARRK